MPEEQTKTTHNKSKSAPDAPSKRPQKPIFNIQKIQTEINQPSIHLQNDKSRQHRNHQRGAGSLHPPEQCTGGAAQAVRRTPKGQSHTNQHPASALKCKGSRLGLRRTCNPVNLELGESLEIKQNFTTPQPRHPINNIHIGLFSKAPQLQLERCEITP